MVKSKKAQMKIQQMAFMVLAVFLFFILVGLFFLSIHVRTIHKNADQLYTEAAISSFQTIINLPEMNHYGRSNSLDEDKLYVLSSGAHDYSDFWHVASIKVYKVYPASEKMLKCPALNCNYFEIFDKSQRNVQTISTFVSICKKVNEGGYVYDRCEIGKLDVGVIKKDE
jgi:hypothetical protein